ncbi:hypothetical protein GCM10027049_17700 [Mucilaginibacter puniceus]
MALEISTKRNSKLIYIIGITLLVGTLDLLAAVLMNWKTGPAGILKYIASGVFGPSAFDGGNEMVWYGLLFHYGIALLFTTALFLLHPMFYSWFRTKFLTGIIYGIVIWLIMSHGVVPLSYAPLPSFTLVSTVKACSVIILCVGLPISYISTGYYFYKVK